VDFVVILEGIVGRFPAFAPAWKELSNLLDDPEACLEAITRGLAAAPDDDTRGMLLIRRGSPRLRARQDEPVSASNAATLASGSGGFSR
jgi:hypothetical protein